ncbi:MAG: helix-turn-helix transcriptional regulator [Butyrivibrio sp.]|uniref:helix-turn-helix domain-containing protein n=1 Tax=Butyrivibrio sp. TaxID=28121 RepID=UPI001B25C1A5|nr:helix-turn-helix transcriptional regulator [Butyrivibrio sp.]MBO6242740.1 helix-turn-helix transcriptional regulator [Butyrivibrio sp.]
MQIGSKIFEILKKRGITQKEFSMKTGIAESTISDWKRKGFNPSAAKLPVICNVLGVSLDELLDDDADSSNSKENIDYSFSLSNDEKNLIELFRNADAGQQKRIYSYVLELMKINGETVSIELESNPHEKQDDELASKKLLCKRLRRLSRLDRITLDESEHASGFNKHLFKYFDFIGVDKLDYIKKYLEHIQPFMIKEVKTQEKFDNAICVLDEYYRISVYIKLDATKGEEVIVSFHENNKNGVAKREPIKRTNQEVYVFPESISSHVVGTDKYTINLFITRGATSLPMTVSARKCDDEGFWVRMSDISRNMIETANSYLQDLYTAELDYSEIEPFYSLQQISFTSYGTDVFSGISLLIDSLLMQMSPLSKQVADSALCIFCSTIELPDITKKELLDTLRERYKVNSVKILPEILRRVELNLL